MENRKCSCGQPSLRNSDKCMGCVRAAGSLRPKTEKGPVGSPDVGSVWVDTHSDAVLVYSSEGQWSHIAAGGGSVDQDLLDRIDALEKQHLRDEERIRRLEGEACGPQGVPNTPGRIRMSAGPATPTSVTTGGNIIIRGGDTTGASGADGSVTYKFKYGTE